MIIFHKLATESGRATSAAEKLNEQTAQIERLEQKWNKVEESQQQRRSLFVYLAIVAAIIALSVGAAAWAGFASPNLSKLLGTLGTKTLAAVITFVACHLVLELILPEQHGITRLWPFQQVRRFRRFLWIVVILGFVVGVLGNLYANFIQKNIDAGTGTPSKTQSASSATPSVSPTTPPRGQR